MLKLRYALLVLLVAPLIGSFCEPRIPKATLTVGTCELNISTGVCVAPINWVTNNKWENHEGTVCRIDWTITSPAPSPVEFDQEAPATEDTPWPGDCGVGYAATSATEVNMSLDCTVPAGHPIPDGVLPGLRVISDGEPGTWPLEVVVTNVELCAGGNPTHEVITVDGILTVF